MGAIAGLYGAMMLGIFAAIFGGTSIQVSGPTGPMTVVSTMLIQTAIEATGSLQAGMGLIITTFLLAGVFQILFGILKIGKYIKYIPYPVVSGFMSGIGVLIIVFQLFPLIGYPSPSNTIDVFLKIPAQFALINISAFFLGMLTCVFIYLFPNLTRVIPSILIALVLSSFIAVFFKLNVPIIGDIPSGLPTIKFGTMLSTDIKMIWIILNYSLTLAALGSIDSLLTAVVADNITVTKHNSNQELIGQGIGNIASAIIGGLPGAGATMRTVTNATAGGNSRLSGLIHGLFLMAILLGLGKYAAYIPLSVLAGILITVGIGIIDYKGLRHIRKIPTADAVIFILVFLITVFSSLLHAVTAGLILASILFMKKASDLAEAGASMKALVGFHGEIPWDDECSIYTKYKEKIFIKHLYGPLFFGVTSDFKQTINTVEDTAKLIIIRMEKVTYIDQSGLYAMEESILSLLKKNTLVILTGVHTQPLNMLKMINIIPSLVRQYHTFETFEKCEIWLKEKLKGENGFNRIWDEREKDHSISVAYRF